MTKDPVQRERELAWIGDSVLGLYARQWILDQGRYDAEEYSEFTRNQSLSVLGPPTSVEAIIGDLYLREGLPAAFAWIEEKILPLHLKRLSAKARSRGRH